MPLPIVSPNLFNGHGLGATIDEPHAQPGNHIRINTHPLLGLPVAPFIVWRGVTDSDKVLNLRKTVRFHDRLGRSVTAPFSLTPDNPVTATLMLAPGEQCIWARVIADPIGSPDDGNRIGSSMVPGRLDASAIGRVDASVHAAERLMANDLDNTSHVPGRDVGNVFRRMDRGALHQAAARAGGGMLAEAFVSSVHGPASAGRRNLPPYTFTAPGIIQIQLTGHAAVVGVEWLEARAVPKIGFEPWTVLNLPHEGGPRYASIENAVKFAVERVNRQAPKRQPLQETLGTTAPGAAPLANAAFERARVESMFKPLLPDLDSLITDLSQAPFDQRVSLPVADETGDVIGDVDMSRLDRVFQGQFDPGVASFIGYKGYDDQFVEVENRVVFYWVEGYFRDFPPRTPVIGPAPVADVDAQMFDAQLAALGTEHRFSDVDSFRRRLIRDIERIPNMSLNKVRLTELEKHDDYIGLGTLLVVDRRAPLLPVGTPRIVSHTHVDWLPSVIPPAAKRETRLDIAGVVTGGLLAAEKQDTLPVGSGFLHLNKKNDDGFHLPLVLGMDIDDETLEPVSVPGTGFLGDRNASPVPIRYGISQQDRFGRWSGWRSIVNNPGNRPKPPQPVLEAYYTQPANPAASPAKVTGTVRIRVAIPTAEALAPASFVLDALEIDTQALDMDGNVLGPVVPHHQSSGTLPAAPGPVDVTFSGTALSPTERQRLRIVARWVDSSGQLSVNSEPVTLTLTDPRPPPQLTVPDELQYSARPDVTGLSIVEHTWTPLPSQANFGVYYSDENRLRAHLEETAVPGSAEADLLAELDAATDEASRASRFRANASLFPGHLFERLDGAVMEASGGRKRFRHAVSGSLRVLNIYRVSAESESNARVDLAGLPLILFGVPNADPPATPVLLVTPTTMSTNADTYAVDIEISLVTAITPATSFRLRRSSLGAADVVRMPIVKVGTMPAPDADGRQHAATDDAGPVLISDSARLKPWVRYHWIAEVQGQDAPGSGVGSVPRIPGLWSAPSESVSLILTPPQAPAPASGFSASGLGTGDGEFTEVSLHFTHPHGLSGGAIGYYRARILRRLPDGLMLPLDEVNVSGDGPFTLNGLDPEDSNEQVPAGTLYRLVLIDPLGRESTAVDTVLR